MSATWTEKPAVASDRPRAEPRQEKTTPRGTGDHNRRWWSLVVLAAVVAAGGGYGYARIQTNSAGQEQGGRKGGEKSVLGFLPNAGGDPQTHAAAGCAVVPVEVVRRGNTLRLTGSLAPDEQSFVASNTNGIVAEVRVDRGSVVKKGDVLVQLDPTDAKNRLAEGIALAEELKAKLSFGDGPDAFVAEEQPEVKLAKATLALTTSRLRRAEGLLPQKAISLDECEQIRAEHQCAEQRCRQSLLEVKQRYQAYQTDVAKLAALRKTVVDTTILAPFDGLIVEKQVAVGEQVTGGFIASKIVALVRINPLRISLTVPQQSIGQIQPGQKVSFRVDSFPERVFQGAVRYISPVVTNDTRSMVVEAVVPNPDGLLRPGLFATAELELAQQQAELLVPASAVQRMDEVARVFVVRGEVAREQVVALGRSVQDKVEIRSGLTGQELLVARPELVHDGDVVRPVNIPR